MPYRIPEAVRENKHKEIEEMLQQGVIEQSDSPWASPVVLLPKRDAPVVQAENVTEFVGDNVTLQCMYSVNGGTSPMCWGRGSCPRSKCTNAIIWTDGEKITWYKSERYQVLGNITQGNLSLSISGVTRNDTGTYCCRVEIPGFFNDIKEETHLNIQERPSLPAKHVTVSVADNVTLSCKYSVTGGTTTMCWGRGSCPSSKCDNEIITTDGQKVTWNKCERYQLLGDIVQGDVSLTISGVTPSDAGTYCCRVETPGWFNDIKEEKHLEIKQSPPKPQHVIESGGNVTLPCKYTVSGGTATMCWGRGSCPPLLSFSKCNNEIIWTDGQKVTWNKSDRYQLLGDIAQGDVSLTISGITPSDAGTYCCRVEIPGFNNDVKEERHLNIQEQTKDKGHDCNA
ncbi:uncharacterized protein LOC134601694 [Pelobates fuscus]|uniref:uncharacterized protein LOC134601694 n=1 Tax=Pelobates fuscus TaxID=191477 RepID=UPI002FE4A502